MNRPGPCTPERQNAFSFFVSSFQFSSRLPRSPSHAFFPSCCLLATVRASLSELLRPQALQQLEPNGNRNGTNDTHCDVGIGTERDGWPGLVPAAVQCHPASSNSFFFFFSDFFLSFWLSFPRLINFPFWRGLVVATGVYLDIRTPSAPAGWRRAGLSARWVRRLGPSPGDLLLFFFLFFVSFLFLSFFFSCAPFLFFFFAFLMSRRWPPPPVPAAAVVPLVLYRIFSSSPLRPELASVRLFPIILGLFLVRCTMLCLALALHAGMSERAGTGSSDKGERGAGAGAGLERTNTFLNSTSPASMWKARTTNLVPPSLRHWLGSTQSCSVFVHSQVNLLIPRRVSFPVHVKSLFFHLSLFFLLFFGHPFCPRHSLHVLLKERERGFVLAELNHLSLGAGSVVRNYQIVSPQYFSLLLHKYTHGLPTKRFPHLLFCY